MVSVEEASRIIFSALHRCESVSVQLDQAIGFVLAESIYADRAFPPFDRVSMDGIAINFEAFKKGTRDFRVQDIQPAGHPRKSLFNSGECMEVMTGAILPAGTDTVIRYEDLKIENGIAVIVDDSAVTDGQNVHRMGMDAEESEELLSPGIIISAAEVALLASVGKTNVNVVKYPSTAVVSTGDELVDVSKIPLPHQIRKSNVYAVQAGMQRMNWQSQLFHIADDKDVLTQTLTQLLNCFDVLIISGGVSKGKFDFIPEILESLGVTKLFQHVSQRPGKPFWFGKSDSGKAVFALPGNPVSTFMCFYRYIRPWLLRSAGVAITTESAVLSEDFSFPPKLTYFLQVRKEIKNGVQMAIPVTGGGSGDFANLKAVTGFLELPANETLFKAGSVYHYFPFR
jgi:molybdopterin molybdotransferase